jgi:hypothetical protein
MLAHALYAHAPTTTTSTRTGDGNKERRGRTVMGTRHNLDEESPPNRIRHPLPAPPMHPPAHAPSPFIFRPIASTVSSLSYSGLTRRLNHTNAYIHIPSPRAHNLFSPPQSNPNANATNDLESFSNALSTSLSLLAWTPSLSVLPTKHTDSVLTRTYTVLTKSLARCQINAREIFAIRSYALSCLIHTTPGTVEPNNAQNLLLSRRNKPRTC